MLLQLMNNKEHNMTTMNLTTSSAYAEPTPVQSYAAKIALAILLTVGVIAAVEGNTALLLASAPLVAVMGPVAAFGGIFQK